MRVLARGATRVLHLIVRSSSLVMPPSGRPVWLDDCRSAASIPAVGGRMNGQLRLLLYYWSGVQIFARGATRASHLIVRLSSLVMPLSGIPDWTDGCMGMHRSQWHISWMRVCTAGVSSMPNLIVLICFRSLLVKFAVSFDVVYSLCDIIQIFCSYLFCIQCWTFCLY